MSCAPRPGCPASPARRPASGRPARVGVDLDPDGLAPAPQVQENPVSHAESASYQAYPDSCAGCTARVSRSGRSKDAHQYGTHSARPFAAAAKLAERVVHDQTGEDQVAHRRPARALARIAHDLATRDTSAGLLPRSRCPSCHHQGSTPPASRSKPSPSASGTHKGFEPGPSRTSSGSSNPTASPSSGCRWTPPPSMRSPCHSTTGRSRG